MIESKKVDSVHLLRLLQCYSVASDGSSQSRPSQGSHPARKIFSNFETKMVSVSPPIIGLAILLGYFFYE